MNALDAADCEYVELPDGGIMWTTPAIAVPFKAGDPDDDESEAEELPWAKAELSQVLVERRLRVL